MLTFIKAQASAIAATVTDFLVFSLLLRACGVFYLTASVTGNLAGGVTSFLLGRQWVFDGKGKKTRWQVVRYVLVWNGNLALNTGGVYLLKEWAGMDPIVAKVLTAVTVGVTWNYFLQKKFVFR